ETPGVTETQRQSVELARDFARTRIEPFAAEWDRRAHFDRAVIDELGRLGFLGLSVPEEYDGMGLDTVTYLLALEEIAAADASVAVSLSIHNAIPATMLIRHGSAAQKQRWLKPMARGELLAGFAMSEAEAGSDAAALRTQAARDGDGWVLSGARPWGSRGGPWSTPWPTAPSAASSVSRCVSSKPYSSSWPTWRRASKRHVRWSTSRRRGGTGARTSPRTRAWPSCLPPRRRCG